MGGCPNYSNGKVAKSLQGGKEENKGVVFGVLSKFYSRIKTRSYKNKRVEAIWVSEGPRDLIN